MDLEEKDFIHEEYPKHPYSLWFWLLVCLAVLGGAYWLTGESYSHSEETVRKNPFLQVTNREYSLFLWQNPAFMKQNLRASRYYLPAWDDRLTVEPKRADEWVEATPEALFMYHTWNRLLGEYYYPRDIPMGEFLAFLKDDPEWDPEYWPKAPVAYKTLVKWMREGNQYQNLRDLSYEEVPLIVRKAFIGWKNYTREGRTIDGLKPTWRQLWTFLEVYPNFKRPFWINFLREERPKYLQEERVDGREVIPEDRLDGLIKMALYNYLERQK